MKKKYLHPHFSVKVIGYFCLAEKNLVKSLEVKIKTEQIVPAVQLSRNKRIIIISHRETEVTSTSYRRF